MCPSRAHPSKALRSVRDWAYSSTPQRNLLVLTGVGIDSYAGFVFQIARIDNKKEPILNRRMFPGGCPAIKCSLHHPHQLPLTPYRGVQSHHCSRDAAYYCTELSISLFTNNTHRLGAEDIGLRRCQTSEINNHHNTDK